jgi:hypothetical protein
MNLPEITWARPVFLPAAGSRHGLSKKKKRKEKRTHLPVSLVLDTDGQ